jgi:hypothetical protein
MTTQIPPAPKRQRLTAPAAIAAKEAAAGPVSTVICQFRNAQDGTLLGPAVSLPADTGREGLELLVNNLRGTVSSSAALSLLLLSIAQREAFLLHRMRIRFRSRSTCNCLRPSNPTRPRKAANLPLRKKASVCPSLARFTPTS